MDLDMDPRRVLILPPWALCAYNCPVLGYMPSKKQFDGDIGQYDLHSASWFCALLIPTKVARRFAIRQKKVSFAEIRGGIQAMMPGAFISILFHYTIYNLPADIEV